MYAAQGKSPAYGLCAVAWLGVSALLAQAPRIDSLAPNQLAVVVLDSAGQPAGNTRVDFVAPASGASCVFANQQMP